MYLQIIIFLTAIVTGFAQFYPGGGMPPPYAMGPQPMGMQNPRGMGDYYQMAGYPPMGGYQMPRYVPNFYPPQQHYPAPMPYVTGPVPEPPQPAYQPPIMPGSENTNENANTNVNINSGSYRRSLHNPSKEHGSSRNTNTNNNINMSS